MARIFVKPGEGKIMRHPDGRLLPAEGGYVPQDSYWRRAVLEGDVTVVPPDADPKAPIQTEDSPQKSKK